MNKFFLILMTFTFSLIYSLNLNCQSQTGSVSGLIMNIELYNPKIYKQNDEIILEVKLINKSDKNISCFVTDDKKYCFDFKLISMLNQELEHSKDYTTSFHRVQTVFKSKIDLASNEGYSYKVRLNDYFDLNRSGQFYVKGVYYPDLVNAEAVTANSVVSNQIAINIQPSDIQDSLINETKSVAEEKYLSADKRPPDEVVKYMLDARMKKEWEKYFLYLDLGRLILHNNKFNKNYLNSDAEKQKEKLAQYKNYLSHDTIDDISFLPNRYEILSTQYDAQGKGKVDVLIEFKYLDYIESKYYTFFLYRNGNIWYVENYEVVNIGRK
jgi:hypothetical protein